jgi:formylmethanofuran dehydrogenase subunit A
MTLEPARRLEARVPAMEKKGRVQPGADADLTIFNPNSIADRSTYAKPAATSTGIEYVIIGGRPVIHEGELIEGALFGTPVRAPVQSSAQ